eukprot:365277-Chlamydomonas_euryale.AAC.20
MRAAARCKHSLPAAAYAGTVAAHTSAYLAMGASMATTGAHPCSTMLRRVHGAAYLAADANAAATGADPSLQRCGGL